MIKVQMPAFWRKPTPSRQALRKCLPAFVFGASPKASPRGVLPAGIIPFFYPYRDCWNIAILFGETGEKISLPDPPAGDGAAGNPIVSPDGGHQSS